MYIGGQGKVSESGRVLKTQRAELLKGDSSPEVVITSGSEKGLE